MENNDVKVKNATINKSFSLGAYNYSSSLTKNTSSVQTVASHKTVNAVKSSTSSLNKCIENQDMKENDNQCNHNTMNQKIQKIINQKSKKQFKSASTQTKKQFKSTSTQTSIDDIINTYKDIHPNPSAKIDYDNVITTPSGSIYARIN